MRPIASGTVFEEVIFKDLGIGFRLEYGDVGILGAHDLVVLNERVDLLVHVGIAWVVFDLMVVVNVDAEFIQNFALFPDKNIYSILCDP